jgi:lipoyl(octanoyl) transferase
MNDTMPEWRLSAGLTDYADALAKMESRVADIRDGTAGELLWLVEHPPLYTAGTSARPEELLQPGRLPVFQIGRGGRYTYHGPGQRVVYVMLDLSKRGQDLRCFVASLEQWVIDALGEFGIKAVLVPGKVGVWVESDEGAAKIAAIGVRVRRWISYHGLSVNIDPDMENYQGIQPCGLQDPVTSLRRLGLSASMADFDAALHRHMPAMLARLHKHCP